MKRRNLIRLISYLFAGILLLAGIIITKCRELKFYKNQARYTYSQAFEELDESLSNISLNLQKAKYVTTNKQISDIALTVYTEAQVAKMSIAKFDSSDKYGESINKFLSQVGNYSVYLSRKIGGGDTISSTERKNLEKLSELSDLISKNITDAHVTYDSYGKIEISDNIDENELTVSFLELEESFTDYPTLIYDGPYSDYIALKENHSLESEAVVTETQAAEILAQIFNVDKSDIALQTYETSNISSYHFAFDDAVAAISIHGGHLVYYRKYTQEKPSLLTFEQAEAKARKVISSLTGENFIPTYYFTDNGVCVMNFAFKNGAAICYTDLIKIGIDLNSGSMVLYESRGYLTNHKKRTFETPVNTVEQAREVLSENLSVISYALAIIPTSTAEEILCWEFICSTPENFKMAVYINTKTLAEEQVFKLIDVSGGTLVK